MAPWAVRRRRRRLSGPAAPARSFAAAEKDEATTGMEAPGAALMFVPGGLGLILLELVALGAAGLASRRDGKTFPTLTIAVSVVVLVLIQELGIM